MGEKRKMGIRFQNRYINSWEKGDGDIDTESCNAIVTGQCDPSTPPAKIDMVLSAYNRKVTYKVADAECKAKRKYVLTSTNCTNMINSSFRDIIIVYPL